MITMTTLQLGRRKICKTNYSLTISLPKVWAQNAHVKEDDLVDLIMVKDTLSLWNSSNKLKMQEAYDCEIKSNNNYYL